MAVDFNAFATKAGELYDTWPGFFSWAAPAALGIVGGLCWLTWWLRGHRIETERDGLKEQINSLRERLSLAKEQADGFKIEMEKLRSAVTTVKDQIEQGAASKDLTVSSGRANAIADSAGLVLRVLLKTLT